MEYYRIIILPWPEFTSAFKYNNTDGGGEFIEGNFKGLVRNYITYYKEIKKESVFEQLF
jgi:hypothetical protein